MNWGENERSDCDEREMDLFMQESRRAVQDVKAQLRRKRQVRIAVSRSVALGVVVLIIGVSLIPGPMYVTLAAMREWIAAHVPFRHGPQQWIGGICFSTGGIAYSAEPTRRWIDDFREFEYSDGEWVERFSDDFEQNAVGSFPAGWDPEKRQPGCPPGTDLFIDVAGPDSQGVDLGRSVALIDTLSDNCGSMFSPDYFRSCAGKVAVEWSERHETLDDALIAELRGSQGEHGPFTVGMYGNDPNNPGHRGWIVLGTQDPVTKQELSPEVFQWEPNRWYRLRVEIDIASQTFDFFVDYVPTWSE